MSGITCTLQGVNHLCNRVKGHQASWMALFLEGLASQVISQIGECCLYPSERLGGHMGT